MDQEETEEQWRQDWALVMQNAARHPAQYIGSQPLGHLYGLRQPIRLVWMARAFRLPSFATVLLSPTQYVVRCFSGPLIGPIQRLFFWEGKRLIFDGWRDIIEQFQRSRGSRRGWRRQFGGPSGPRIDMPMLPVFLAKRFAIGYRTDAGVWGQTFAGGWPCSRPFLLDESSPVGLVAAAKLDPQWFTGLPFQPSDQPISPYDAAHWPELPSVTVIWHDKDDLLPEGPLTSEHVRAWLRSTDESSPNADAH